jgi:hypothetical protein
MKLADPLLLSPIISKVRFHNHLARTGHLEVAKTFRKIQFHAFFDLLGTYSK